MHSLVRCPILTFLKIGIGLSSVVFIGTCGGIPSVAVQCWQTRDATNPSNNFVAFLENLSHHNFVLRLSDLCKHSALICMTK